MTILDFAREHQFKKVDYDGAYGAQCVDLFREFCKDSLNIPHTGVVHGAKDIWERYDELPVEKQFFEKLTWQMPYAGDIVVFGATENNQYGHVAIVIMADDSNILVFEQDGFAQNGAKYRTVKRDNVLGFLRKRKGV